MSEPLSLGFCKCVECGKVRFEWRSYFKCPACGCKKYIKETGVILKGEEECQSLESTPEDTISTEIPAIKSEIKKQEQ